MEDIVNILMSKGLARHVAYNTVSLNIPSHPKMGACFLAHFNGHFMHFECIISPHPLVSEQGFKAMQECVTSGDYEMVWKLEGSTILSVSMRPDPASVLADLQLFERECMGIIGRLAEAAGL